MKKKRLDDFPHRGRWSQILLRMKLTFVLVFCMLVQTFAAVNAQTVTLKKQNASLEEIIWELKEQTKFVFLYSSADVATVKGIDIDMQNSQIDAILKKCLEGTDLQFVKENNAIIIRQANGKTAVPQVQSRKITGKVIDEDGNPLPGVAVLIEGTTIGVATDMDGKYDLTCPEMKDIVLKFSYIGMKPKSVVVGNKTVVDVTLESDSQEMDEVVVTGLLNRRKSGFAGTTTVISKQELAKVSTGNIFTTISTLDAGFKIEENNLDGSNPNKLPDFTIRGKGSFQNGSTAPIFILDGFEVTSQKVFDMDINRIESITLLKDASATILYGSRASNGVIVIETTAPKAGKLRVTYDFKPTIAIVDLTDYDLMNAREKLEAEVASGVYQGSNAFGQDLLNREYHAKLSNVLRGVDTDWLSQPLRTAFNHQHSLYLESGAENLRFGVELNYNNNDGVMKGSFRDRAGVGLSVDYRIGDFQIRNYFSYTSVKSKESPYGIFSDYTKKLPYDEMKDEYGQWLWETTTWHDNTGNTTVNPLYEAGLKSFDKTEQEEFVDNLNVNWYVTPHLQLKGQVSVIKTGSEHEKFVDPKSRHNTRPLSNSNVSSGELHTTSGDELSWNANVFAAYNYFLNEHNINLNVGFNIRTSNTESLNAFYRGFPSGILHSPNYAQEIVTKPTANQNKTRLFGVVSTLNYSYRNIWLLDVAFRSDGSSEFGSDRKFAPFWSGGVGINFHNFAFMQQTGWVNTFRLKGSYGVTGKVNFAPYSAQTIYQIQNDEWYKTGYGATLMALGNMSLGWEKTRKLNIGADLELWKGALQLSASWYKDKTVDLINDVTIPASSGFRTYVDNVGEVVNKGVEINLRGRVYQSRDWMVNVFANLAHNKNEILKVAESLKAYNERVNEYFRENMYNSTSLEPFTQYVEGGSLTSIYAMRSLGIDPATGEELLLTKKGDITTVWNTNEQVIVGNKEPKAQGTLGFNVSFKGFSLYATFLYEFGGQRYNSTLAEKVENVDVYNYNVDKRVLTKRWQKPGDHTKFKALQKSALYSLKTNPTERFVQDYNVLSLNSLTLGYDFKSEMVKKWGLGVLRFEVGANDLFRLSSVKAERGLSYPYARNINFSLSVSL